MSKFTRVQKPFEIFHYDRFKKIYGTDKFVIRQDANGIKQAWFLSDLRCAHYERKKVRKLVNSIKRTNKDFWAKGPNPISAIRTTTAGWCIVQLPKPELRIRYSALKTIIKEAKKEE